MSRRDDREAYVAGQFDALAADPAMFPDTVDDADWQWQAVRDALTPLGGMRVLDAGCAKGKFSARLVAEGAEVTGVDVSPALIQAARRRQLPAHFEVGSVTALPFPDASFDAAIIIEVLEHVPDLDAALTELGRVLRPGGSLLVVDKNRFGLHPEWPYPVALYKWWQERQGRWMYPADAPVRERWFGAGELRLKLQAHVGPTTVHYLRRFERTVTARITRFLPALGYDILWHARRQP